MNRLQWKMTLRYMFVTIAIVLMVEGIALTVIFIDYQQLMFDDDLPQIVEVALEEQVIPLARNAFQLADDEALTAALSHVAHLRIQQNQTLYPRSVLYVDGQLFIFDATGKRRASAIVGDDSPDGLMREAADRRQWRQEIYDLRDRIDASEPDASPVFRRTAQAMVMVFPVQTDDGTLLGTIGIAHRHYGTGFLAFINVVRNVIQTLSPRLMRLMLLFAVIGLVLGYLSARGITRRLANFSTVTKAWSEGNFSTYIEPYTNDELGQLARRMNRMAAQIQKLMHAQQQLAAAEERNHLARELHDSVKQQVFAAGAQLRTGRIVLETRGDIEAADTHLNHTDDLLTSVRNELMTIVQHLRADDMNSEGLIPALEQLGDRWQQRTGIQLQMTLEAVAALTPAMEKAIYRVTQEALSNIEKHSHAQHTTVDLTALPQGARLMILDDGDGFEVDEAHDGFGLLSMRQRITQFTGGEFEVHSALDSGTAIIVRMVNASDPSSE